MLSYRHGFHAGNHADVFKHLVQWCLLRHFKKKDKPFVYIDTHSGAGWYDLTSETANKTAEYQQGVATLLHHSQSSQLLFEFCSLLKQYFDKGVYPGSPEIAVMRRAYKIDSF